MALADLVPRRGAALSGTGSTAPIGGEPDRARKRRYKLYLVGSAVAAAGIMMGTMPVFLELTPVLVAKGCALAGAIILAVGRFAPDHLLKWVPPRD